MCALPENLNRDVSFAAFAGIPTLKKSRFLHFYYFQPVLEAFNLNSYTFCRLLSFRSTYISVLAMQVQSSRAIKMQFLEQVLSQIFNGENDLSNFCLNKTDFTRNWTTSLPCLLKYAC